MLTDEEKVALFEEAKVALAKNPTEGQVEKSVVFPLLQAIGYENKNILSKVTVRVKAGSKNYENLQVDVIAKDDVLPTIVVEAKSPSRGLTLPNDYSQGMSYCVSPDVNTRFLFLTSGYSNRLYEADTPLIEYDLKTLFSNAEKFKEALLGKLAVDTKTPSVQDIERFFSYSHNRMYAEDAIKPAEALHILTKLSLIKTNEESFIQSQNNFGLRTRLQKRKRG